MSYHIYQTDGIVLKTFPVGEADMLVDVFTRALGLVRVNAKSARTARSKFRYGIQPFTIAHFAFVRGREVWRLTGVHPKENIFYTLQRAPEARNVALRVYALLARLIHGQEPNTKLFDTVCEGITYLKTHAEDPAHIRNIECLTVLRILHHLGYVGDHLGLSALLGGTAITHADVAAISAVRREAVQTINASLKESQL